MAGGRFGATAVVGGLTLDVAIDLSLEMQNPHLVSRVTLLTDVGADGIRRVTVDLVLRGDPNGGVTEARDQRFHGVRAVARDGSLLTTMSR